jgi:hypothetical protein
MKQAAPAPKLQTAKNTQPVTLPGSMPQNFKNGTVTNRDNVGTTAPTNTAAHIVELAPTPTP